MKPLHEELGVAESVYEKLCLAIPAALIAAIKVHDTPEGIKAATITAVLSDYTGGYWWHEYEPPFFVLIGIMVEQAYNAAVLQSKEKKPFFEKAAKNIEDLGKAAKWRKGIDSGDKITIVPPDANKSKHGYS